MKLQEYQSKLRFAEFDIPIPIGAVAITPGEVYELAKKLGGNVVVKAQVLSGGRGKAGGIRLAKTPDEAKNHSEQIFGMNINGFIVEQVLVDTAVAIYKEIYLAIINDRAIGKPLIIASSEGGMEIETVAKQNSQAVIREYIDPIWGLKSYQANSIASRMNLPKGQWRSFIKILTSLWQCFEESDAELVEINPLVIHEDGSMLAVDGKIIIDDSALSRQPKLAEMLNHREQTSTEIEAHNAGISYIKLNGTIGCMVNGAGLAMATMDITKLYGGDLYGPANFLDIGGGADVDKVSTALRIILSDDQVKVVLVNIFGGITRCDAVASGFVEAYKIVKPNLPIVMRLQGTNAQEGQEIINRANIQNLYSVSTLTEAAQKAVAIAKGDL